ncbi:hypothetical protein [Variovorax gossypii]
MTCVFASAHQWATVRAIAPQRFTLIAHHEADFGVTIHRKMAVAALADTGSPYETASGPNVALALSEDYTAPVVLNNWTLPPGAFAQGGGPS